MRRHGNWRHDRRAKQRRWLSRLFLLALAGAAGGLIYDAGRHAAQSDLGRQDAEIRTMSNALAALDKRNAELAANLEIKRLETREWRRRYEAEVPSGVSRELLLQVKSQLQNGTSSERLAFAIRSASASVKCATDAVTRRFLVRTPIYKGTNDAVTFAGNAITVTAQGESATDAQGRPYGWFDAGKPVAVKLKHLGGKFEEVNGLLPLHYSLAVGRDELRFSFTKGNDDGFLQATATRCKMPATGLSN